MLGTIFGDISGSIYEFNNVKMESKVKLFNSKGFVTDDSIMTLAIAKALMEANLSDDEDLERSFVKWMVDIGRNYPDCGYGNLFYRWIFSEEHEPYNSFGNGSAMRVSAIAYVASSLEDCLRIARLSALVSHNHIEGIKGAQAVAGAVYLALNGSTKSRILAFVEDYYSLDSKVNKDVCKTSYDVTCQGSVPKAINIFLKSDGFLDSIRKAVASGGDSDTIAAIVGGISGAFYGISKDVEDFVVDKLDDSLLAIVMDFQRFVKEG